MSAVARWVVVGLMLPLLALGAPAQAKEKEVLGLVEKASIHPGDVTVRAKVDTGAKTTSLHCDCIHPFERNGAQWVSVKVEDQSGRVVTIERKVARITSIKRHSGESQERYVIMLGVCVSDVYKEVEVNVVDRTGFNYPMLIGRNFLKGDFVVDPELHYTHKPRCKNVSERK
jgi:hypothetical protein